MKQRTLAGLNRG